MIYVGIDDTDSLESRGTGRLARNIAAELSKSYILYGVTRHQLFVHPAIPFTSHNSCAVIQLKAPNSVIENIFNIAKNMILGDFVQGSDPGLAVASSDQVTSAVAAFGIDAKKAIVTQQRAREVAKNSGMRLEGLGGTEGGVIGAVAGIGLASLKNDGRFLLKDRNRELSGIRLVSEVIDAGIDQVMTLEGVAVNDGKIQIVKSATPSFLKGMAVLFVEEQGDLLVALKRD